MRLKKNFLIGGLMMSILMAIGVSGPVHATDIPNGLSVSPISTKIVLTPGDSYSGEVTIYNPSNMGQNLAYEVRVDSFFVDDDYAITLGTDNDYNRMKDWISLNSEGGILAAGESVAIGYEISVPLSAPAGGQYAAIVIATKPSEGGEGTTIREVWQIASPIYASISGQSVLSGTISDNSVSSFALNPPIEASFVAENTGNVHADATCYMQVYPLFSDEEIYTNEEDPEVINIMPGTKREVISKWEETPRVGVFRVAQTVKAFGGESTVERIVVICPIWLLFIIVFAIIMIIFWFMTKSKSRKKSNR